LSVILVRVRPFGVLKDLLGGQEFPLDLPEGATVSDLLDILGDARQAADKMGSAQLRKRDYARSFQGIAVSVNAQYANGAQVLRNGDEVGLLPPVSGGTADLAPDLNQDKKNTIALKREVIDREPLVAHAKHGEDGAVVVFDGIVRNNTRGRQTLYLDYEAYEEMALKQMESLALEARDKFPVRHVTMIHRLGRLEVGQTSVLIIVASAHRAAAFDACRWLIDTLKKTVPIWKKETFQDGAVWAAGEPFPGGLSVGIPEEPHDS